MMTDVDVRAALTSQQALGLTMWAEARRTPRDDDSHSPVEELIAVGCVVRNRLAHPARWRALDGTIKGICLAPMQFSCWNEGTDSNHLALMTQARLLVDPQPTDGAIDPEVYECLFLAGGVIAGVLRDRTNGSTSYWAPAAMVPPGRVPSWAFGKTILQIGDQNFLTV